MASRSSSARSPPASPKSAAIWRRWSGALLASGLGLTFAVAWYHFQGLAPHSATLIALAIGIVLFVAGMVTARKAARIERQDRRQPHL